MTASVRTLGTFTIGLAALATIPATPLSTPINASAAFDASAGSWRPDLPSLLRFNVRQWLITDGQDNGPKTAMTSAARPDGRVIVYLDQDRRGPVATHAEA